MERRNFIKETCRICLLGAVIGAAATELSSCSPSAGKNSFKPAVKDNQVEVPLSLFDGETFRIISPAKYPYEISIEKQEDNVYRALLLRCTHYQNQLTPTGSGFFCSAHGSKFDKEGKVVKGPAENSLEELKTEIQKNNLLIHLI